MTAAIGLEPTSHWHTVLMDVLGLFAVVWSLPFAILLVGAPIALALWLGRMAFGAF